MLAATCENVAAVRFPVLASPKLDGIRCLIHPELGPVSRNLKPIPNQYIRATLAGLPPLDGELIVGEPCAPGAWNATQSGVMSEAGEPNFTYWVFDRLPFGAFTPLPFSARVEWVQQYAFGYGPQQLRALVHTTIADAEHLSRYEAGAVAAGYEGVMLRAPDALYKLGRSTLREGGLLKVKRFHDAEARVVGTVERLHNANEAKTNALGLTERSTHKANKVGTGTLGALVCEFDAHSGTPLRSVKPVQFELGTGFDDAQRQAIWDMGDGPLLGRRVKFKYQALTPDGVPRFPVFLGFRDDGGADE